jgi:tetratricopeptide (TPR) repeat protein
MRQNVRLNRCLAMLLFLLIPFHALAESSPLDRALELQKQGKLKDAEAALDQLIPDLRSSREMSNLSKAVGARADISLALSEYQSAAQFAHEALELDRQLKDTAGEARDLNVIGASAIYMGKYGLAVENFREALKIDQTRGDAEGEAALLDNLGNAYYFQGRYQDAFQNYQEAQEKVAAAGKALWAPQRNQITVVNLATLYQRLGSEEKALELYRSLSKSPRALSPSQEAQLLLNEGALYRRLGDPVKAIELYKRAQRLFAQDHNLDTEIGAWRNIGISQAMDLGDLTAARQSFTIALELSQKSSNMRGIVQAHLYRGEVLRRMHQTVLARSELQAALDAALGAGLIEDQWKALVALGRVAEDSGRVEEALDLYRRGVSVIESVRAGLTHPSLRTEFLGDKRSAYDSLISLLLAHGHTTPSDLFEVLEQTRARTLQDRRELNAVAPLKTVQERLPDDTLVLEFWNAGENAAVLWFTKSDAESRVMRFRPDEVDSVTKLIDAVEQGRDDKWRGIASLLGKRIFDGLPLGDGKISHLIVVPDGMLNFIPFELLMADGTTPVIEKFDVTYLPSASLLAVNRQASHRPWIPPWRRVLVAFGDPGGPNYDGENTAFPIGNEQWRPLPHSTEEVRTTVETISGRSETHLGADARKKYLSGQKVEHVPVIHFSTHAVVDTEYPGRSRILLASEDPKRKFDYLFLQEVQDLDFNDVDLVVLSACETQRGKVINGEGVQSFSRAFLTAGAGATLASLWRVDDAAAAEFMKQFYYALARGDSEAEALRWAKLRFYHSGSALTRPRYWAAFVITGDSRMRLPHTFSWGLIATSIGILAAAILIICGFRPHAAIPRGVQSSKAAD